MSKANADIKYDPELPYVVLDFGGHVIVRFADKHIAEFFAKNHVNYKTVIDTTPKPKIPEDAEFIFVEDADQSVFARREGLVDGEMLWLVPGDFITESELIEDFIGDSEITVLVRKE